LKATPPPASYTIRPTMHATESTEVPEDLCASDALRSRTASTAMCTRSHNAGLVGSTPRERSCGIQHRRVIMCVAADEANSLQPQPRGASNQSRPVHPSTCRLTHTHTLQ
ncbi:unnamed protein product, partial [Ectocarpus sp. 12 AP-2014]